MRNKYFFLIVINITLFTSSLIAQSSDILGYNIYRNNEKINDDLITELSYNDSVFQTGSYDYYVTAVYADGESGNSNIKEAIINLEYENRQYVVAEKGTGTWCGFCPAAANGFDEMHEHDKKVLTIAYHANDAYSNTDAENRIDYYNVPGFPTAYFDGITEVRGGGGANQSNYNSYLEAYENRMEFKTAYGISLSGNLADDTYSANIIVENLANIEDDNLRLMAVVVENHIEKEWLGLNELNDVARMMIPNANGTALDLNANTQENISLNFTLNNAWNADNCSLIVFIQNINTKEIHAGNILPINDFASNKTYRTAYSDTLLAAPFDLTINYSLYHPNVNLTWKQPQQERWVQWDENENRFAFGSSNEILDFDVAAKWTSNELQPLDGMMITKMAFFPNEASCEYNLRVWSGESDEEMIIDSLLENLNAGEWNEFTFENPLKIDVTKELWLGYYNNNTKTRRSAGCDNGPAIVGKGNKIRLYNGEKPGTWQNLNELGIDANWNIKMYLEPYAETGTGLTQEQVTDFEIYPNPANDKVVISGEEIIRKIYLINVNGALVSQINANAYRCSISIDNINTGVYFVKIETENGFQFKKLVVE